jgi:glycosyltransferase involved in cell wall biosynthesis
MNLSVIIPVFNEKNTVEEIISRVEHVQLEGIELKEIIIVDDGSTDGTRGVLNQYKKRSGITLSLEPNNKGKGATVRKGFELASGDLLLVQDSDLEYNPDDYSKLLAPILSGNADVVYGSRFVGGDAHRVLLYWHSWGNKVLTTLSNMFTDLNLTDMECGYKVFRKEIIDQIKLKEDRFGFEPEVTAKIAKLAKKGKCSIYEIGVSYFGRNYHEGKKINWKDGLSAIRCIIKYNLLWN